MGQFDWTPDEYLERIRLRIPRYDELQEQAVAAVPFPPERVLELGMGTGETTRRLIEAHPDAWVIGLDSSPDMVFRARQTYDDVQLARMEDPLPDGPWDLVISVLSVSDLDDDAADRLSSAESGSTRAPSSSATSSRRTSWRSWSSGAAARSPGRPTTSPWSAPATSSLSLTPIVGVNLSQLRRGGPRYHSATDGRPEEENLQRPPRQAARQRTRPARPASTAARAATARAFRTGSARPAAPTRAVR